MSRTENTSACRLSCGNRSASSVNRELAANAAIHSHSRLPGGTFTVRAKISPGDYAWIEVEDNGGPWTPVVRDPSQRHGLDIVRTLANECGIDGDQNGRTIWARFDWTE